jgi:hypothetical protein
MGTKIMVNSIRINPIGVLTHIASRKELPMQQTSLSMTRQLTRRQLLKGGATFLAAFVAGSAFWETSRAAATIDPTLSVVAAQNESALQPVQEAVVLTGIVHSWQTLNNCGPAILAMNMSYYGVTQDQQTIAQALRPNSNDQNVRPDELVSYALHQGFGATLRVNGNGARLRQFLSNGIPVILETWESDDLTNLNGGFAHFRLVTGYDDINQRWIVYDSYFARDLVNAQGVYRGMYITYAQAETLWRIMNRKYVVIYTAEQASLVQQILASDLDDQTMWQGALVQAQTEVTQQPNDPFAWFNLGSSRYACGSVVEAVEAFHQAIALNLPTLMFWYQYELLEAYYAMGQYAELVNFVDSHLGTATGIEEFYYWKALALAALGTTDQAYQTLNEALAINPNYGQALTILDNGFLGRSG